MPFLKDDEVLRRFFASLVRRMQEVHPDQLEAPFTVAEIYQDLVPYRTHRDQIGVALSADYEHALLRLLGGEGDYLILESPAAREEIRRELESPTPNTGLYREFAAADVRLNPKKLWEFVEAARPKAAADLAGPPLGGAAGGDLGRGPEHGTVVPDQGEWGPLDSQRPAGEVFPQPSPQGGQARRGGGEGEGGEEPGEAAGPQGRRRGRALAPEGPQDLPPAPDTCPWCRENLPRRPGVRFCPYCGSNVRLIPCPECGEELELNWRFCIACGTEVTS